MISPSADRSDLPGRWVNSHHLLPGDKLVSHDGKDVLVVSIELRHVENIEVFNLTVYYIHTFAVGDDAIRQSAFMSSPQRQSQASDAVHQWSLIGSDEGAERCRGLSLCRTVHGTARRTGADLPVRPRDLEH